jgi:hypothetical protein
MYTEGYAVSSIGDNPNYTNVVANSNLYTTQTTSTSVGSYDKFDILAFLTQWKTQKNPDLNGIILSIGNMSGYSKQYASERYASSYKPYIHLKYNVVAALQNITNTIIVDAPLYPQAHRNTCGTACAIMALNSENIDISNYKRDAKEHAFITDLYANVLNGGHTVVLLDDGYTPPNIYAYVGGVANTNYDVVDQIKNALNDYSNYSYSYTDISNSTLATYTTTIKNVLQQGKPVIAKTIISSSSYFSYSSDGHYVLIRGYYKKNNTDYFIINDPHYTYTRVIYIPVSAFYTLNVAGAFIING